MEFSATTANREVPSNARNQRAHTTPVRREPLPNVGGSPSPDLLPAAFDRPAVHARPPAASINRHFLKVAGKTVFVALAAAVYASASAATTPPAVAKGGSFTWPSAVAPCNTTLQACINGVPDDSEILVTTSLPINEEIFINRSVRLLAARNVSPRFAAFRGITGNFSGETPWFITLRGFRLTDAGILLFYAGKATATMEVADMEIESINSSSGERIDVFALSGSSNSVRVRDNRLRGVAAPSLSDALIRVEFEGGTGTHTADISWNEITGRGVSAGWAILASADDNATAAEFRIQGNTVRGEFQRAGIMVSDGRRGGNGASVTARVLSNTVIGEGGLSGGISSFVRQGSTNAQIINNTVVRANGIVLSRWTGSATGTTSGSIFNNLIVANRSGLQNQAPSGTANNDYNLLRFNVNPGAYTPGANDINADPQLRSLDAPRLGPGSPAIDAGNSLALIGGGALPLVDGDGLRRLVNGDGSGSAAVDIGAYEYGHRMLLAPSNLRDSNYFPINDALINAGNGTRLFTALNFSAESFLNARPTGVFFFEGRWNVFNQDLAAMPSTLAYNVFHPLPSIDLTMHTVTTTIPGFPNASVLPSPDAGHLVLAEQNWNGSGTPGVYNNNPIAVGSSGGEAFVHNANGVALPAGAKFNIYSQPPTPNFFRVDKQAGDPLSDGVLQLNHPLLNGNPCARIVAVRANQTPSADAAGAIFDLIYNPEQNRWSIFSLNGSIIGKAYNVLVVPEQVSDCTQGPLFRDQFEP